MATPSLGPPLAGKNDDDGSSKQLIEPTNDGGTRINFNPDLYKIDLLKLIHEKPDAAGNLNENVKTRMEFLIKSNPGLLKTKYNQKQLNKTIVEIACSMEGIPLDMLKILLEIVEKKENKISQAAYFHAIGNSDHKVLQEVLDLFKSSLNTYDYRNLEWESGLLHLIKNKIIDDVSKFDDTYSKHVELLLTNDVMDYESADRNNKTAVWWAASKKYKKIVKLLVEKGVNLDRKTIPDPYDTARKLIQENNLLDLDLMGLPAAATVPTKLEWIYKIKLGEENLLIDAGDITLDILIELCLVGSKQFVEQFPIYEKTQGQEEDLLKKLFYYEKFLEIAAEQGYYKIFEILLKGNPQITFSIVIHLIKRNKSTNGKTNYETCLNLLIEKNEEEVIELFRKKDSDSFNNTPLYFAVRSGNKILIQQILKLEPSLASKNDFGFMPLDFITAEDLETHLDNCIAINEKENIENLTVNLKFQTLLPQKNELQLEMAAVNYMCHSAKLKHLVVHPVIAMFLSVKWKNMLKLFCIKCGLYVTFMALLLGYIYVKYYANSNFGIGVICVILCLTLVGFIGVFIFRELFELWKGRVSPRTYFLNFENGVKLMIIGLTLGIICSGLFFAEFRKELLAFTIVLFALGFVLVLGHHPKLAIYVVMFRAVMWDFCKLFVGSSIMIIAFAITFHILFADDSNNKDTTTTAAGNNSFNGLLTSIFKTIVMATGEYDSGTIDFNNNPISSRIIFCLFVFTIGIILFNLLNGLAIGDIQTIKNNAEFVCLSERVQHIEYVEYLVLGKYLEKFPFLDKYLKTCLNHETELNMSYYELLELYSDNSKFKDALFKKLNDLGL